MIRRSWSVAGQVYGVDIDTGNSGALYADSFILHEHYRSISNIVGENILVVSGVKKTRPSKMEI